MAVALLSSLQLWLSAHARSSSQNPTTGGGEARGAPLRAEELLAVGCHRGRESHFSFGLWPLVGCPCSRGWPRTQVPMNSANRTRLTKKKKGHEVGRGT